MSLIRPKEIHQANWMQKVPIDLHYFKCKTCEIQFSFRAKSVETCPYCKGKDIVRIPLCAFLRRRPGRKR